MAEHECRAINSGDTEICLDCGKPLMITYTQRGDSTGDRFRQYAKDKVPAWAVDVRPELPKN